MKIRINHIQVLCLILEKEAIEAKRPYGRVLISSGVSKSTYHRMKAADCPARFDLFAKIARELGLTLFEVMAEAERFLGEQPGGVWCYNKPDAIPHHPYLSAVEIKRRL